MLFVYGLCMVFIQYVHRRFFGDSLGHFCRKTSLDAGNRAMVLPHLMGCLMLHRFAFPLAVMACLTTPVAALASDFSFCWVGANGYTMTGKMSLSQGVTGMATEKDVTAFKIAGYRNGTLLGTWDMADLHPGATWHLRFDTATQTFPTGGSFPTQNSQGWNADGGADDCGNPGFGFNSGNHAQDVCVDGHWARDSSIAPESPLTAVSGKGGAQCQFEALMSKSSQNESF